MGKIKVWEKPTILVLGVEETQEELKGPCINPKHIMQHTPGELFPMVPGHGYWCGIS
jgi:hypothetical protein